MKRAAILIACLLACAPLDAQDDTPTAKPVPDPEQERALTPAETFLASLTHQTGEVQLSQGGVSLVVPENFYYLSPEDSERVLVEAWGNPPGIETLGMIFPAEFTPLDAEAWGANIYFEPMGYVRDDDAADLDYDELLESMQDDTRRANDARVEAGYPAIELVGWAAPPHYDSTTHQLYWAKTLRFDDTEELTLNYEIQTLGRRGVLTINFIAVIDQFDAVEAAAPAVLEMPRFNEGHRYIDFDSSIDTVAAVGIGGLIAGGVLQKTGILAILLLFLKKGWVLLIALFGGAFGYIRRLFGGKKPKAETVGNEQTPAPPKATVTPERKE